MGELKKPRTKNPREREIIDKYTNMGYSCLKRGYPDFCFYNEKEIFFVEVKHKLKKPSKQMGLNIYQIKMIELFKRLGINVRVEYVK